jgi:hypothetical protein
MNVSNMYCAKTWITVAVLHTEKYILQKCPPPPKKMLIKIQPRYILHAITNVNQLNHKHATFL